MNKVKFPPVLLRILLFKMCGLVFKVELVCLSSGVCRHIELRTGLMFTELLSEAWGHVK